MAKAETLAEQLAIVKSFKDEKLRLDGSLIPLSRSVAGTNLLLMVRHITPPFSKLGEYAQFFRDNQSLLFVNLIGLNEGLTQNIGFIDWLITDTFALCRGHQACVIPHNVYEELAKKEFGYMLDSFFVMPEFRKKGVGSFLAALSLSVLSDIAVSSFLPGEGITEGGKRRWKKFGLAMHPSPTNPIPLGTLPNHPYAIVSIADFVE